MSASRSADFGPAHSYRGTPLLAPYRYGRTVLHHLAGHARARGDAPFLTTVDADGVVSAELTYRELLVGTDRFAAWLRRQVGSGTGEVVGFVPRNDAVSVVAILGLLRAGHPVLLLNPADPVGRRQQQVAATGARLVLRAPGLPGDALPGSNEVPDAADLPDAQRVGPRPAPAADALVFGTSGSTAASKLVVQSHYNAVANGAAVRRHHRLRPGDRLLGCLPIHHVNGLHFTVFGTLVAGAHVMLADAFHPFGYPRLLTRFRPRIASVVPSMLETLLETWRRPAPPGSPGYFVSAAAPLLAHTAREVTKRFGVRVVQGYGLTETTNFATTMPVGLPPDTYRRLVTDPEIPSIGTELAGNEVAVLRADGSLAEPGETGEICMRGHNVMTRYAGNAAETAEAFRHGWFHSQDLGFASVDPATGQRFFVITGRRKNIAKVGGAAVSLDELERALRALPQVRDAACAGLPDRFYGEQIAAAVVFAPGDRPDLRAALRPMLATAALPRRIVAVPEIPRTPTGKILRPQVAELLAAGGEDLAPDRAEGV